MYTHQVVIIRQDTTHDFYYNVNGTLTNSTYVNLTTQAKADGKMISEEMTISDDGMILERRVVWDSKQSFTDFLDQWLTYYPNYKAELKAYNDSVDHYAMLIT
jgi:hypothetical protein